MDAVTALPVPLASPLPSRAHPMGDGPLQTLFELPRAAEDAIRGGLTPELRELYDGELTIPLRADRPTLIANFVETIDGVVAMDRGGRTGGGDVSGFSPTDRFTMGLLRSLADVVLVGAGTIRSSGNGPLTPGRVHPASADAYARLRASLGLPPHPVTLIATTRGDLDPDHPVFGDPRSPIAVAAPPIAIERLRRRRFPAHVRLETLGSSGGSARGSLGVAARLGARLVLAEGGPHLLGDLMRDGLVDELFLTVSPQIAGRRGPDERLSLVEGAALWPDDPRWARLRSIRRAGDHLFLRYQLGDTPAA